MFYSKIMLPFSSNSVLKKGPEISTLMQNDFKKFTANAVKRVWCKQCAFCNLWKKSDQERVKHIRKQGHF